MRTLFQITRISEAVNSTARISGLRSMADATSTFLFDEATRTQRLAVSRVI